MNRWKTCPVCLAEFVCADNRATCNPSVCVPPVVMPRKQTRLSRFWAKWGGVIGLVLLVVAMALAGKIEAMP